MRNFAVLILPVDSGDSGGEEASSLLLNCLFRGDVVGFVLVDSFLNFSLILSWILFWILLTRNEIAIYNDIHAECRPRCRHQP
ncbi:MAG: hypothetical protein JWQ49_2552 [Edaphobacter sp.]|nr:hypothetical protein [Edaphobacter sp.]